MLRNYIISAIRSFSKNKAFSLINVLGIAIGLASVIVIGLYVQNETSYDTFFKDSDRIYRVALKRIYPERERLFASSPAMMADIINENYPEVELAARMHRMFFVSEIPVQVDENLFTEPRFYFADSNFFELFSHNFLYGDPNTALDNPTSIVVTEATAVKYYGRKDVLNETVTVDTTEMMISGVIENIPMNSHIQFDIMGNIHQVGYVVAAIEENNWLNPWLYTYIKLRDGVTPTEFEARLDSMVIRFGSGAISQALGPDYIKDGHRFDYFLQPLEDIHLHSALDVEVQANGDYRNVVQLGIIAIIILVISSINFINLSTAKSAERAREVGVRKVMGSLRHNLFLQFITESVLITFLGSLLAVGIVILVLPFFNDLLNKNLNLEVLYEPIALLGFLAFILITGIISGIYPALRISAFQPTTVLKGSFRSSKSGNWLRNFLIVFQFFISIIMISTTVAVNSQMSYLRTRDLGFDRDNVLVVQNSYQLEDNYDAFRNELLKINGIKAVGGAFAMPGDFLGSNVMKILGREEPADFRTNSVTVDDYFFETMQFKLSDGRSFNKDFNDSLNIVVNEALVRDLGLTEPLGTRIQSATNPEAPVFTIIGIVKDYHFASMHSKILPLVLFNGNTTFIPPITAVKINNQDAQSLLPLIEDKWSSITDDPFTYSFLDQNLQQQYRDDLSSAQLFDVFTYLAIFISCIGLFGLATYLVQQKTREMSIRKVMGAAPSQIAAIFLRDFLKLTILSFLLAVPAAYWAIGQWMDGFAYHIPISITIFLVAGLLTTGIILFTLAYQVLRIVNVNPVEVIRD